MILSRPTLYDFVAGFDRVPVVPLLGFPGIHTTQSTIKQNVFNHGIHFQSILGLAERFQPDVLFPMMDLTLEANALGAPVRYDLMAPPSVDGHLINSEEDLERIYIVDITHDGRINAFLETMRLMARYINLTPAGYVIGPYTLASQLMGASSAAKAVIRNKDFLHKVLVFSTHVISLYVKELEHAGAQMICVLEPSSMLLSPGQFAEFSGQYLNEIYSGFDVNPILHICGDTTHLIEAMVRTGAQGLSLDSMVDFPAIISKVPENVVLIGNINPVEILMQGTSQEVYEATARLLDEMRGHRNFILSTGCDLPEDTPFANLDAFMSAGMGLPLGVRPHEKKALVVDKPEILKKLASTWLSGQRQSDSGRVNLEETGSGIL